MDVKGIYANLLPSSATQPSCHLANHFKIAINRDAAAETFSSRKLLQPRSSPEKKEKYLLAQETLN